MVFFHDCFQMPCLNLFIRSWLWFERECTLSPLFVTPCNSLCHHLHTLSGGITDEESLVLSCRFLSCLVLSCLVLSCLVLSCLVLSVLVLSCLFLCIYAYSCSCVCLYLCLCFFSYFHLSSFIPFFSPVNFLGFVFCAFLVAGVTI